MKKTPTSITTKNVTETLYKSLVQPLLDYCDVAWSPGAIKLVDQHQKLAARIVLGATTARTVELYKTLNCSTLDQCRRYHIATYVFTVLKGLSPPYITLRDYVVVTKYLLF